MGSCSRTQRRPLKSFISTTTEIADEQVVTPQKLFACLEKKIQFLRHKTTAYVGKKFIHQESKANSKLSISTALAILLAGKIYTVCIVKIDIRLLLKNYRI